MSQLNFMDFQPPPRPVWIVILTIKRSKEKEDTDTKYVRAATMQGAIRCAKFHSFMPRSARAFAYPATPQDLGCVRVEPPVRADKA